MAPRYYAYDISHTRERQKARYLVRGARLFNNRFMFTDALSSKHIPWCKNLFKVLSCIISARLPTIYLFIPPDHPPTNTPTYTTLRSSFAKTRRYRISCGIHHLNNIDTIIIIILYYRYTVRSVRSTVLALVA